MSLSRSVYLSRLRRAFLLRVHPDRFRNQSPSIRSQQASLVQALSNRLGDADFAAWQSNSTHYYYQQQQHHNQQHNNNNNQKQKHHNNQQHNQHQEEISSYNYIVERRDGSFHSTSLKLNDSVEAILQSMARALEQSGAASLPAPPKLNTASTKSSSTTSSSMVSSSSNTSTASNYQQQQSASSSYSSYTNTYNNQHSTTTATATTPMIDHRYDVQSRQGRHLLHFLRHHLDHDDIHQRRVARMDAQAAAAQVRQVYEFQMVDAASSLGWSSASVAVLLSQLLALHEEHGNKFHVPSFYPLRLEVTYSTPASSDPTAFDIFGGILRLNPASTPLQWLTSLQLVTPERLELLHQNRNHLLERSRAVSSRWGIKLVKGHSCSSRDYHVFVKQLYNSLDHSSSASSPSSIETTSTALTLEPIVVTIEASQAIRKPMVTKEGTIRLQTAMTPDQVRLAVARLAKSAREQAHEHAQQREACQDLIRQLQWQLGLQKIYRTSATVNQSQFWQALSRLQMLVLEQQQLISNDQTLLQRALAGNSLGIASSGHFCHLADDGSVVIPYDWR